MGKYVALLRGINVAGQKSIKMESLRNLLTDAGFLNVQTYIQSGNIIFESKESAKSALLKNLQELIKTEYGFDVRIIILTHSQIQKAVNDNPFLKGDDVSLKQLYIAFLDHSPAAAMIDKFYAFPFAPDLAVVSGDVVFVRYLTSAGNSKLSNSLIESKLSVTSTMRNWNTALKLLEMSSE